MPWLCDVIKQNESELFDFDTAKQTENIPLFSSVQKNQLLVSLEL